MAYLLPFYYSIFFILIPTYQVQNYLIGALLLFWIPTPILITHLWHRVHDALKPLLVVTAIHIPLTIAWEFLFLYLDLWHFDTNLCGVNLFGVPVEEWVFWWGAGQNLILTFLYYLDIFDAPKTRR